jgi:hypothetical protein
VHTVVETRAYLAAAKDAGIGPELAAAIVDALGLNPAMGDEIAGTGGCRKVRFAGRGKGKSGGYRVITFYSGEALPLFLLTVFGKGERSDLSQTERNDLRGLTKTLVAAYRHPPRHRIR